MGWLTGWLSPEGKLYECESWNHEQTAKDICKEIGADNPEFADVYLCSHGWIDLTQTNIVENKWLILYVRKPTQEQYHFLKPYIEENINNLSEQCIDKVKRDYELNS